MPTRDTRSALLWITGILNAHNIPFQMIGGFAARLYGAKRDLADIDIGIPEERIAELLPEISPFITYGPAHYIDNEWDTRILVTLVYKGQEIDLPGADTMRIFDKQKNLWLPFPFDASVNIPLELYGIHMPVIPKGKLVMYKTILGRDVDLMDIKELGAGL